MQISAKDISSAITIQVARTPDQFESGKLLFKEYAASLGFDLCFQDFETELDRIGVQYNLPTGALLLVYASGEPQGCAGIRYLAEGTGELKRMYLRPGMRGQGLGRMLLEKTLEQAYMLGYSRVRLDTQPVMKEAVALYRKAGFHEIQSYRYNPDPGALFFETDPLLLSHRYPLGFFPTPLHALKHLSAKYPGYNLFIKRDDHTGLASGGNKTRKLEYFIYDALHKGCNTILSAGAQQSNHCRQTAAACAIAGIECHLALGGTEPQAFEGNLLLSHLLGAKIHFTGENRKGEDLPAIKADLEKASRKCYIIPYGGSDALGAMGFVNAIAELKTQLDERSLNMDYLFFASSSGGTQAGLTLGMELYGIKTELMPVNIDKENESEPMLEEKVLEIVRNGERLLHLERAFNPGNILVVRGYDKAGYGVVTDRERSAIRELASAEGILLDPVYTGRAFYAMTDHLEKKKLPPGSNVLFWHTGGFPANFYYGAELK